MLDYYGSIMLSEEEIDNQLIQSFRDKCNENYIHHIIQKLRKEELLSKVYSVSGWMMFHKKSAIDIITFKINHRKQINEKKLKFIYCYIKYFNDIDICRSICDII